MNKVIKPKGPITASITIKWKFWSKIPPSTYTFDFDISKNYSKNCFIYLNKELAKNLKKKID
ncbi:unnamed protein product [Moneuplotes crassus]|uniref:Uncharacterized protein n=1 Tax=Euplotes crassus TaxID=5936 RepID=A0AAD1XSS7_EUPCR|nr:unnamed protein product [Moneuplotes crassus]